MTHTLQDALRLLQVAMVAVVCLLVIKAVQLWQTSPWSLLPASMGVTSFDAGFTAMSGPEPIQGATQGGLGTAAAVQSGASGDTSEAGTVPTPIHQKAQARMQEKLRKAIAYKKQLDAHTKTAQLHSAQAEQMQIQNLIALYTHMPPSDAARILEALDTDTMLRVAVHMPAHVLAPILAHMQPDGARKVTHALMHARGAQGAQ